MMGAYLAIIRGVISLANWVAQALQQHHDELNGENKLAVRVDEAALKGDRDAKRVETAVSGLSDAQLDNELRGGAKAPGQ